VASKSKVPAGPVHGRREIRKLATRRQLLAAGRALFSEQGLYDSNLEDLTNRAGIAKGTLYGYFADKEDLIHAVVAEGFAQMRAEVEAAAASVAPGPPRIRAVIRAHFMFYEANPDLMRIFHQVRGLLKFHRPESLGLRSVLEQYVDDLATILRQSAGVPGRRGGPARERARARMLFGAASGITSVLASLESPLRGSSSREAVVEGVAALIERAADPGSRRTRLRQRGGSS
jgi:AcrR family transcriptional regulator